MALHELGMSAAEEVMIAGCSAGGLAAYTWVDNIAARFDKSKVNVYGVGDAGIFLDVDNVVDPSQSFRKIFQNFM